MHRGFQRVNSTDFVHTPWGFAIVMVLTIAVVAVCAPFIRRSQKQGRRNLERLAALFREEVETSTDFSYPTVNGSYKGRPITAEVRRGGSDLGIWIHPKRFSTKQPLFLVDYPPVTESTYRMGNTIVYKMARAEKTRFRTKEWSVDDFMPILEELTRAAEQVESRSTPDE